MYRPSLVLTAVVSLAAIGAPIASATAQQSQVAVSPFVTLLPTGAANPLAGLAITLGGASSGFALRGSGNLALEQSNVGPFLTDETYRPWGLDADAMLYLAGRGSYRPTVAPFVFAGVGLKSTDSTGIAQRNKDWSFGAGLQLPLGSAIDLFGQSRWRMANFVLPTAKIASRPTTELSFGLTFHVGNSMR